MKRSASPASTHTRMAWLGTLWQGLPQRQRQWATAGLLILAAALLWWIALQPALTTLRTASAQRQALDLQLHAMRQLQAEATAMRATNQPLPALRRDEAQQALTEAVRQHLGESARLAPGPKDTTLTLEGVSGQALAQWLAQARIEARTLPTQAHLERQAGGTWKGQMTLALPPASAAR
jgi:general secretion pathway protein M